MANSFLNLECKDSDSMDMYLSSYLSTYDIHLIAISNMLMVLVSLIIQY